MPASEVLRAKNDHYRTGERHPTDLRQSPKATGQVLSETAGATTLFAGSTRASQLDYNRAVDQVLFEKLLREHLLPMIPWATLIGPGVLAGKWKASRREVLKLMLQSTKLGIFNMEWRPPADQKTKGPELVKAFRIQKADVLTSCSTCHR